MGEEEIVHYENPVLNMLMKQQLELIALQRLIVEVVSRAEIVVVRNKGESK